MVLDEVTQALEKRRAELVDLLENQSHTIELEKQHQIFGAINEIDLFLHTINYYEQNSSQEDITPIRLAKPIDGKKDLLSRIFGGIKGKVQKNK